VRPSVARTHQYLTELNIEKNVIFHNRFVPEEELHNFLCAADLYVTPYLSREQLTSGTLSFAVGSGKAVISTPYWAAQELLAQGRGKLVRFNDPEDTADKVIEILNDPTLFYSLRRKAYDYGRNVTWPKIGQKYWKLFLSKEFKPKISIKPTPTLEQAISILQVPEPPLDHLERLTDDTGVLQHAKFITPHRKHGYCTDDNARAAIVMAKYYAQYADPKALKLLNTYLAFIYNAQNHDGSINNFMKYDRTWIKNEPASDALGRVLWALGSVMANPPQPAYISVIKEYFDRSVNQVPYLPLRGLAYSIIGLELYLKQFPGASEIKHALTAAADKMLAEYKRIATQDWQWFENILAYDNAILPAALFVAANALQNEKYLETAQKTCEFFIKNTYNENHFSFVGCNGWYHRGKKKANFDQQPIEVASTILMLTYAHKATNNNKYQTLLYNAFDWFFGKNDLNIAVYDFRTKGCCDGLEPGSVNINQGAESLLSFLLSLLFIIENYESAKPNSDRTQQKTLAQQKIPVIEIAAKKPQKNDSRLENLSTRF